MIKFIFGRSATGKTETIFRRIKEATEKGTGEQILIVPEQSTFDCEKKLLHLLDDGKFTGAPVLNFTRLCDEVSRHFGGLSSRRITDCERVILMSRAVSAVADKLVFFSKYAGDVHFIENAISAVDEFKRCGIDAEGLRSFSGRVSGALAVKLADIALIIDTYEALIENKYSDPSDDLIKLDRKLGEYAYFAEKTVYIDSFKNFTGAQMKIIERIITQADEVTFSFLFDKDLSDDGELFSNVAATIRQIEAIARKHSVECAKPEILTESHYNSEAIKVLERALSVDSGASFEDGTDDVAVLSAPDKYGEAELVCREISRLVREEGYRYRDFLIVARHDEHYRTAVEHMCRRYELPCFIDRRSGISHMPLSVFTLSLLRFADNLATEEALRLLKTDLAGLSELETATLENYLYIWKINGKKWLEEWNMSPSGLDKFDEDDKKALEEINSLRLRVLENISKLRYLSRASAQIIAESVWNVIERGGVAERLADVCLRLPADEAEQNRQSYGAVAEILDSLVGALGDENVSLKTFCEYLTLSLSSVTVGTIPQMLDEISFGSADRIMPREPKVTFMLGMNQGVFPSSAAVSGIIAGSERLSLMRAGMPITDYTLGFSVDEEYLVYKMACSATDKIYFSYSTNDAGEEAKPSGVIDRVIGALPNCKKIARESVPCRDLIETAASAFTALMRKEGSALAPIKEFLSDNDEYAGRMASAENIKKIGDEKLSPERGELLFGKNMYLSATGIDTYFRCAFSYFCRYGMGLKTIKPAEIDSLQRGTIVHEALEKIVSQNGKNLVNLTDEQIVLEVDRVAEEFLNRIPGIEQIADNRFMYAIAAIKSLTVDVIKHIRADFAQNGFEPVKCELKISGPDADIDGAVITARDGSIKLRGAIDRVDRYGAYIRVVDYKTGSRKFRLPDVLYGLNMQMLLYLYAVIRSNEFKDTKPAGVLYLETRKAPDEENNFRMNGIIAEDEAVHAAMDRENGGRFVPKLKRKKDGSFYKSNDFIAPEHFEDIFAHMEGLLAGMNEDLRDGRIPVNPTDGLDKDACKYCDFAAVCGIEDKPHRKVQRIDGDNMWNKFKGGEDNV
ncbi:MAG: PD-(D/E)XK nuclease family protein [Clostridia bacterium]|nr:PD-(D/E)XK nuclease family protein [Clostridia bacterium]